MNSVKSIILICMGLLFLWHCTPGNDSSGGNGNGNGNGDGNGNSGESGNAIIIDHSCTDLSRVPHSYIDKAKADFRIGYSHTSHGSQIVSGIMAFRGNQNRNEQISSPAYNTIAFTYSDWGSATGVFLADYWANDYAADLGHNGDLGWRDATVTMLNRSGNDRNVVMWSWCGGVSDNSESGINSYLNAMAALETQFPNVRFIYMTGHLDGTGSSGNLHIRNEQIRKYCRDNGKILFDFADIESYDPSGNAFLDMGADDGCYYNHGNNNWASEWLANNPGSELAQVAAQCWECQHSNYLNCVLKGRAFWWMMARMAGWDGN